MTGPTAGTASADVVVLLGSRLADLEEHGTRWRAVLTRWARDPRVRTLSAVDFPKFGRSTGVREQACWLPRTRSFQLRVLGPVSGSPLDPVAWRLAAYALRRALGPGTDRVAVAATPLSVRLLPLLRARRTAFDAVDDWRALPSVSDARSRVVDGYRSARDADVVTAVSDVLGERLASDFDLEPVTVGNAVEPQGDGTAPAGLPTGPFAVYVGTVQERVDLDLLESVARVMPVVVAGPATGGRADRLREMPISWLGPVPVDQVPGLLSRAAVGLLPHTVDALTTSMAPMKLLEYVAAGLPVVSTRLPGVEDHPRVRVAPDAESFAALAAASAAQGRCPPSSSWLAQHSWDRVADDLLRLLLGDVT